ncbi:hypothetical protein ACWA1C_13700 [Flectobacillus roseus]
MFLKHYEGLSDTKIIENLNLNIAHQLFSGVVLAEGECIKDLTLLSSWRTKFGIHMDAKLGSRDSITSLERSYFRYKRLHNGCFLCGILYYLPDQYQTTVAGDGVVTYSY